MCVFKCCIISIFFLHVGIKIGLMSTAYAVDEVNGGLADLEVCAELNVGTLERNITVTLTSMD